MNAFYFKEILRYKKVSEHKTLGIDMFKADNARTNFFYVLKSELSKTAVPFNIRIEKVGIKTFIDVYRASKGGGPRINLRVF